MAKEKKIWKLNLIEFNSIKYGLNNPTPKKNIDAFNPRGYLLIYARKELLNCMRS